MNKMRGQEQLFGVGVAFVISRKLTWPRGEKTFFMLNSAEHEI